MPGNYSRTRRQHTTTGEDDDDASSFSVSRAEDSRAEPFRYAKVHPHVSESRRTPPSSKSDMRNEASSSSRRRDADEWRPAEDRYAYSPSKDGHRRGGRDDPDDRDSDSRAPPREALSPSRQWTERHDQDHSGSKQQESSTPRYDSRDRDSGFSRWTPKDNRSDQRGERNRKGYNNSHNRQTDSWGRDEPRDAYNERRRDNGWSSRRRSNADDTTQYGSSEPPPASDDRSWEPSSSWQPAGTRNDNQGQRKQRPLKNKKGKKHINNDKRPRDWRTDDGHLNKYVELSTFSIAVV